jgi:hypothetical protein
VRRGVIFRLNPKTLGFWLEKVRCEPLSIIFWVVGFRRSTSFLLLCPCAEHFFLRRILDVRGEEGYFFRLNP